MSQHDCWPLMGPGSQKKTSRYIGKHNPLWSTNRDLRNTAQITKLSAPQHDILGTCLGFHMFHISQRRSVSSRRPTPPISIRPQGWCSGRENIPRLSFASLVAPWPAHRRRGRNNLSWADRMGAFGSHVLYSSICFSFSSFSSWKFVYHTLRFEMTAAVAGGKW